MKTENVMFDLKQNKFILIDFGFSKVLAKPLPNLSQTSYFGTFPFVSPEMQKLYFTKGIGQVNLYQNDLWGLEIIKKRLKDARGGGKSFSYFQEASEESSGNIIVPVLMRGNQPPLLFKVLALYNNIRKGEGQKILQAVK